MGAPRSRSLFLSYTLCLCFSLVVLFVSLSPHNRAALLKFFCMSGAFVWGYRYSGRQLLLLLLLANLAMYLCAACTASYATTATTAANSWSPLMQHDNCNIVVATLSRTIIGGHQCQAYISMSAKCPALPIKLLTMQSNKLQQQQQQQQPWQQQLL